MRYLTRCRYCGKWITSDQDHEAIQQYEYNGPTITEYFHSGCKDSLPEAISNPRPEGYHRLQAWVMSTDIIRTIIDERFVFIDFKKHSYKLYEIRNSSCIYFKGMVQVDIPDELYLAIFDDKTFFITRK